MTHLGQLPFMLITQMARTWALKEDSVNTSIIHRYSTYCATNPVSHMVNAMNKVLKDCIPDITMPFLDDIPIKGCSDEEKDESKDKDRCRQFVVDHIVTSPPCSPVDSATRPFHWIARSVAQTVVLSSWSPTSRVVLATFTRTLASCWSPFVNSPSDCHPSSLRVH